jgi:dihydroxyacetone kinase-like protein
MPKTRRAVSFGLESPLSGRAGHSYTRPTVSAPPNADMPVSMVSGARAPDIVAPVAIDAGAVRAALGRCRRIVERHAGYLTRLDAILGDGDHGDNLVIGFRAVDATLAELPADTAPGALLRAVGHRLVSTVGGASGPLYGTAFLEAGAEMGDSPSVPATQLAAALTAAAAGLARRGRCAVGDKTILDTLAPAAETFDRELAAGVELAVAYAAAVRSGAQGMRSTRPLVARRGLAMRLGDRAVGHLDPGAVSCLLLLRALGGRDRP